jgi:hypothetical protein
MLRTAEFPRVRIRPDFQDAIIGTKPAQSGDPSDVRSPLE